MTSHKIKSWERYFQPVWEGIKNFELRTDDRGYREGDIVELLEFIPNDTTKLHSEGEFTGRRIEARIEYLLTDHIGLVPGHVVLALRLIDRSGSCGESFW